MKSDWYNETLQNLPTFAGWFPRIYLPSTNLISEMAPDIISHQTLAIIDSVQEIKVGVGYDWDPVVIG